MTTERTVTILGEVVVVPDSPLFKWSSFINGWMFINACAHVGIENSYWLHVVCDVAFAHFIREARKFVRAGVSEEDFDGVVAQMDACMDKADAWARLREKVVKQ